MRLSSPIISCLLILLHQTHAEELNHRAPNVASSSIDTTISHGESVPARPADDLPTASQHRMAQEDEQQSTTSGNETKDDKDSKDDFADMGGNGIPLPVLIIGFGFGAYMARKRMLDHNSLYQGRWIVGSNDPDADTDQFDDDGYNVQSRTGGNEM